jgi:hypothetical protein
VVSPDSSSEQRVRLISQGYNAWKVQVLFHDVNLSSSEISDRLQEVKLALANKFGVPDKLLEYTRLISKSLTRNGLLVQMQITKQDLPSGPPRFEAQPVKAEDGTMFSDMRVEAGLYPFDEFDQPVTRLVVEARLAGQGFDLGCIIWEPIAKAIEEMQQTLKPVFGLEIGRGVIPGLGKASRLTYGVRHEQEKFLPTAWMGVRPVFRGDFLVEVSPSVTAHRWGKNVYGRELEPRKGLETRLAAGDGSRLVFRGTQLIADRDGLLVFERIGRDKRDRNAWDMVPARLTGHVFPMKTFSESQVFDLDLAEPAAILATVQPGSRIHSSAPLFIEGDVQAGSHIECSEPLRVSGNVTEATVVSASHVCVCGFVARSNLDSALTLQIDGGVLDADLHATDVVAREIRGGSVEALHQSNFQHVGESGGQATAIRINLRKFLERQQKAGKEALEELRHSLMEIVTIFGPEITLQVTESTAQRLLLRWLRDQKQKGLGNFTHVEVQEFRAVLEMIPLIREQLAAIGMELRDTTAQLTQAPSPAPPGA